jgi:FKBP-type peptidyl-prolyl cis-trans isomerase FklB
MKNSLIVTALSLALAPLALAAETPSKEQKDKDAPLKDQKDKVSYAIGLDIGSTLKRQMIDVNEDLMHMGIQDGLSGKKPLLNEEQVKETMTTFQKDQMVKQAATKKAAGDKNAAEGKNFLAANKTKEGVKTTASGLQYKVLKEGSGATPKAADTVKVNYRGTTIDGNEFDSSYKRGQPATFPVGRVIKGWTEALQLMKVGSKYQLFDPPDLANAERGAGTDIGPNATLIFEVELLAINPPPVVPPKPPGAASPGASSSPGAPAAPPIHPRPAMTHTTAVPTTSPKTSATPTP